MEPKELSESATSYINGRWQSQSDYFDVKARRNQTSFMRLRDLMLWCSWLTPIAIFCQTLPWKVFQSHYFSLAPLLLSTIAVGTYQWEEAHNYGAQWAKFRLVAERLKGHKELFLHRSGMYGDPKLDEEQALQRFVEYCEGLIEGTDVNYFVLMIDPLRRNQT